MCRSKDKGGRRCNGASCAESRRARQRAYQARVRAARKTASALHAAQETSPVTDLLSRISGAHDRSSWTGAFASLKPALPVQSPRPGEDGQGIYVNGKVAPIHIHRSLEELRNDGRFDVLNTPLTDEDREELASLPADEMGVRLSALRDHFGTTLTVSMADKHHDVELAETVTRYMGDVTSAWVDGQSSEQLNAAREFAQVFAAENASLSDRISRLSAEVDACDDPVRKREIQRDGLEECTRIAEKKNALTREMSAHAQAVAKARASAMVQLMGQTVGSSEEIPVSEISGKKRVLQANLGEVEAYFPDSWKQNTLNLRPLAIRASKARAHYSGASPVKVQHHIAYEADTARYADYEFPTPVFVPSRRRYEDVQVLVGGDPDNPDHVAIMEQERDRLNTEDAAWISSQDKRHMTPRRKAKPRWEVFTNAHGFLALRETFPRGYRVERYESVIRVDDSKSTLTHELSHRMEAANPHLRAVCEEFVRRRSTDENGERETPIRYYKDKEPVYKDNLINAYMGKMYKDKHTEVLSTGMEMLMHGEFGAGTGMGTSSGTYTREDSDTKERIASDKEHLDLIMGLLVSAALVDENTGK